MPLRCALCGLGNQPLRIPGAYLCPKCVQEKLGIQRKVGRPKKLEVEIRPKRRVGRPRGSLGHKLIGNHGVKWKKKDPSWTIEKRDKRNRDIIDHRLSGKKLQEIADIYKVSRERIRQIIKMNQHLAPPERREYLFILDSPSRKAREDHQERMAKKYALLEILSGDTFPRSEVLKIMGWVDEGSDEGICLSIREAVGRITLFGKYIYCRICHSVKDFMQFPPGCRPGKREGKNHHFVCSDCNRIRANQYYHADPVRARANAKKYYNTDRARLLSRRYWMKKQGRFDEIPPLDGPIPPPLPHDYGLKLWRSRATPEQIAASAKKAREAALAARKAPKEIVRPPCPVKPEDMAVIECPCGGHLWDQKEVNTHWELGHWDKAVPKNKGARA